MEAWTAAALAEEHFGAADLDDRRRSRRLVKTAQLILTRPAGTLPSKLPDWSDLMGLYRLAGCAAVTHEAVTRPHRQRTLELMRACEQVVLIVHDSTELDYTHVGALREQLGQIGNGRGRGYLCHNSLALTADGRVLGLAGQVLHRRRRVDKRETPTQKREHPQRESRLWRRGCEAIGAAPAGRRWVDVCDRGADAYEFLEYEHAHGRHYVIRSARDRNLDGEDHVGSDRVHATLHGYARDLPHLGERSVEVAARPGRGGKARVATVRVSAGPVSIKLPHFARGECTLGSLDLWVICVRETDPPVGVDEPLEWILLSNLPADTFAQACEKIDFYAHRPVVEDYHKGMKSGVGIELLQLEQAERLEPVIGLLSVVAALLLQLRHAARQTDADAAPATTLVPRLYVRVLSGHLHRLYGGPRDDLTVRQFLYGVARLGGHLGRKNDGPPGWITLWRGWSDLHRMVEGAQAMRRQECV
jgi:hypothetical protein